MVLLGEFLRLDTAAARNARLLRQAIGLKHSIVHDGLCMCYGRIFQKQAVSETPGPARSMEE